eukprot:scaffold31363_cov36-Phaeocystis_antarctica.AAC.1
MVAGVPRGGGAAALAYYIRLQPLLHMVAGVPRGGGAAAVTRRRATRDRPAAAALAGPLINTPHPTQLPFIPRSVGGRSAAGALALALALPLTLTLTLTGAQRQVPVVSRAHPVRAACAAAAPRPPPHALRPPGASPRIACPPSDSAP